MTEPIIQLEDASRWYDNVIAINSLNLSLSPGVVGLVGPNGAGKTTFIRLITGQIRPSTGTVSVLGKQVWNDTEVRKKIGYCPEHDNFYEEMTGLQFVTLMTQLYGFSRSDALSRAKQSLERVRLNEINRPLDQCSKGMRQKIKVAQALAHDPDVLILDEPLTGIDALSRHEITSLLKEIGQEGRTVVVSSHVLHEIEKITDQFVLIDNGKLAAAGNIYEIRDLIDEHPHRIEIHCSDPRTLAAELAIVADTPLGLRLEGDKKLVVQTTSPNAIYGAVPVTALKHNIELYRLTSPDNNLEAVFRYLTKG